MKPPKFHVGQAVVCTDCDWDGATDAPNPRNGIVYTVADPKGDWCPTDKCWQIQLVEIPCARAPFYCHCYSENGFVPAELVSDEALAELLEEVFTPVHV